MAVRYKITDSGFYAEEKPDPFERIKKLANAISIVSDLGNSENAIRSYAEEIIMQCDIITEERSNDE